MRLTLRTMLAYLDEILEPSDAEQLGKRIEESEFASTLVHRIRGSMKRLRLSAPKLEGKGLGLDPNTVAEYLDNVLPAERVPDFEKVCLESDVHLAETASCHQILTLVLGDPADVSNQLRERVYSLPAGFDEDDVQSLAPLTLEPLEQEGAENLATEDAVSIDTDSSPSVHAKPEVPDYLRAGQRRQLVPLLITVALVFLLVGGCLFLFLPGDQPIGFTRLAALFSRTDDSNRAAKQQNPNGALTAQQPIDDGAGPDASTAGDGDLLPNIPDDSVSNDGEANNLLPSADLERSFGGNDLAADPLGEDAAPLPDAPEPTVDALNNIGQPAAAESLRAVGEGADVETTALPGVSVSEGNLELDDPGNNLPDGPAVLGRLVANDQQMIVSLNPDDQEWYRLPGSSDLFAGDRLTAFFTYRPAFKLASGPVVTLAGPASMELALKEEDGQATQLNFDVGRVLVEADGTTDAEVSVNLAGNSGVLSLMNADGIAAIEIDRIRQLGVDPAKQAGVIAVRLIAVSGPLQWTPTGGQSVAIEANSAAKIGGQESGKAESLPQLPTWINSPDIALIDRRASEQILGRLDIAKPITLQLDEIAGVDHRLIEDRSLAARYLAQLGKPGRLINSFSEVRTRRNRPPFLSYWTKHLATLERELARSPESAAAISDAIKRIRGDRADDFYRILWGYSPSDLSSGGASALVGYLEDNSLAFRVISFFTLKKITGKDYGYHAEIADANKRRQALRLWKEDLDAKLIVHKTAPITADASP